MKYIKKFNDFDDLSLNEEFKTRDISDFFKLNSLRKRFNVLDWDENDDVRNLFYYIYPKDNLDDDIKYLSIDNMLEIISIVSKMKYIPEIHFDKKSRKVKIK